MRLASIIGQRRVSEADVRRVKSEITVAHGSERVYRQEWYAGTVGYALGC
ncbi:MAG: hypothetical protein MZV63_67120 [Marinilabiliales bacterium]|nr:hypothetical protein [Marinilabiliales bacterium]